MIHICPEDICPKVNFELAYYDSAVHRFDHYATMERMKKLFFKFHLKIG